MNLITKFNNIKNNNYFSNIYLIIFIVLSLLLLLFSFFVFIFDFDTSLFGIDINYDLDSQFAMGMYLVKVVEIDSDIPIFIVSLSHFGIFTIVCFASIIVLLIFYYPIFKSKIVALNMFYSFISHLLCTTLLFACFPFLAEAKIIFRDNNINNPITDETLYGVYVFTTTLFTNWSFIFEFNSSDPNFINYVLSNANITWFYIVKYIIYGLSAFLIIFCSFIITKELFSNKKIFSNSYVKDIIIFNR